MEKELESEIIRADEGVNSEVNYNLEPPRPETTSQFWRSKEIARRRKCNGLIDLEYFTR
jgi:hypothetical protein